MDPYLVKKGDFPRISDGFSEIFVGSKGLSFQSVPTADENYGNYYDFYCMAWGS